MAADVLFCTIASYYNIMSSAVTSLYSRTYDLQHHGLICMPGKITGLYPLNLLAVVVNLKIELDCLLMCRAYDQCKSANFVHYSTRAKGEQTTKFCLLHATGGHKKLLTITAHQLLDSTHICLKCMHSKLIKSYFLM